MIKQTFTFYSKSNISTVGNTNVVILFPKSSNIIECPRRLYPQQKVQNIV